MSNCPKCGLPNTGNLAMGLAMAQCVCQFQQPIQPIEHPNVYADSKQRALDTMYEAGWNSAIEMAAFRMQHDFEKSFGKDTLHSIAVWMREMKK